MADLSKIVFDEDVLHAVLSMRSAERRLALRMLRDIQGEWKDADYLITDSTGRFLKVKAARPFLVTYWHDGPVDELRIIALKRVRY